MEQEDEKMNADSEAEEVLEAAKILYQIYQTARRLGIRREDIMGRMNVEPPPIKPPCRGINAGTDQKLAPQETVGPPSEFLVFQETGAPPTLPRYPRVPESVTLIMGKCSYPIFKKLQVSDLNPGLCKLTFSKQGVIDHFLPMLRPEDGKITDGIEVTTYDWGGVEFPMRFKGWNKANTYVLTCGWMTLCNHHKHTMVAEDGVIVWMFRNTKGGLCFAVNLVKRAVTSEQK